MVNHLAEKVRGRRKGGKGKRRRKRGRKRKKEKKGGEWVEKKEKGEYIIFKNYVFLTPINVACQWNKSSPTGPAEQFPGGSFL